MLHCVSCHTASLFINLRDTTYCDECFIQSFKRKVRKHISKKTSKYFIFADKSVQSLSLLHLINNHFTFNKAVKFFTNLKIDELVFKNIKTVELNEIIETFELTERNETVELGERNEIVDFCLKNDIKNVIYAKTIENVVTSAMLLLLEGRGMESIGVAKDVTIESVNFINVFNKITTREANSYFFLNRNELLFFNREENKNKKEDACAKFIEDVNSRNYSACSNFIETLRKINIGQ